MSKMSQKHSYPVAIAILTVMVVAASLTAFGRVAQARTANTGNIPTNDNIVPRAYVPLAVNSYCPEFFDDFSDPASGWPAGTDDLVDFGYDTGEYRIYGKSDQYVFVFQAPACSRLAYNVEVDARWVGPPGSAYSIAFCVVGNYEQYYLFEVNSSLQKYRLLYRGDNGWVEVVSPTYHAAINSDNAVNRLAVAHDGCSAIVLSANGSTLNSLFDSRVSEFTTAGIASASFAGQSRSDARFDNFRTWPAH
jgi:hypothetical protein